MKYNRLFDQFPPVPTSEWMDKINADLRGADFNEKLVWKTKEGFDVMPFYRREDNEMLPFSETLPGMFPYLRGTNVKGNCWRVRQNIEVSDFQAANNKALRLLMNGVDSLGFHIADPESVSKKNFGILLKGIHPESIELNFLCTGKAKEILQILISIISERNLNPEEIHGTIEADPLGRLLTCGMLCVPPASGFDYLASLTESATGLPFLKTIQVNASQFCDSGANVVEELAFGLSAGSEYLARLTERSVDARVAASRIKFSFGIGPDYFMEISKLRAARLLWSMLVKGFIPENSGDIKMDIHSITSRWNKTEHDPHSNLLRTQTEAMSAILGGAASLTVEPFDIVFGKPDEFSERIARNQQLILKEEAYFDKVADPAAGSYYIENMTNLIAENSWKLFVEIEDMGGFLTALDSGFIKSRLSDSAAKRNKIKDNETKVQI